MDIWKWNVALLTRAIWHLYRESDTIWVQFVKQYYLKTISFWDYLPRDRDSFLFKRLCSIRNQLLSHFGGVESTIAGMMMRRSSICSFHAHSPRPYGAP
ncbi:hypothetical protein LIER_18703 [Lithospermum erythrorhizon]|uniref:Maturase K n=1 Tax=Lithospermum erythrorhizon TaxID=34254 RepID=A0AAV3QJD7_LITER